MYKDKQLIIQVQNVKTSVTSLSDFSVVFHGVEQDNGQVRGKNIWPGVSKRTKRSEIIWFLNFIPINFHLLVFAHCLMQSSQYWVTAGQRRLGVGGGAWRRAAGRGPAPDSAVPGRAGRGTGWGEPRGARWSTQSAECCSYRQTNINCNLWCCIWY